MLVLRATNVVAQKKCLKPELRCMQGTNGQYAQHVH
jgi:hypothetical protein